MHANTHNGGHERSDADVKFLGSFAAIILGLTVGASLLMWGLFAFLDARTERRQPEISPLAAELPQQPPEPRLQVMPRVDLQQVRAEDREQLSGYGWVEPNSGTVRIPISRAMQLVVERGLPVRAQEKEKASPQRSQSTKSKTGKKQ